MRIAILGAGSLGTILGAYISKDGVAIELINRNKAHGAVLAYGRQVKCPTPMNDCVVEIIHRIEQGGLKPGFENLKYSEVKS